MREGRDDYREIGNRRVVKGKTCLFSVVFSLLPLWFSSLYYSLADQTCTVVSLLAEAR